MKAFRRAVQVAIALVATVLGLTIGVALSRRAAGPAAPAQAPPPVVVEVVSPGQSLEEMESAVAGPLERSLREIDGVAGLRSRLEEGRCRVTLLLAGGADRGLVKQTAADRVNTVLLPETAEVQFLDAPPDQWPLLLLAVTGDDKAPEAAATLRAQLLRQPGVGGVQVTAAPALTITVTADERKLAARGVAPVDLARRIEQQLADFPDNLPTDQLVGQLEALELSAQGNARVRLADVATVRLRLAREAVAFWKGTPATLLGVQPGATADVREWSQAVRAAPDLTKGWPAGTKLYVAFDFTRDRQPTDKAIAPADALLELSFPPGTSAEKMEAAVKQADALAGGTAGVADRVTFPGPAYGLAKHQAAVVVRLPPAQAPADRAATLAKLRAALQQLPGVGVRLLDAAVVDGLPTPRSPVRLHLVGPDRETLTEFAAKVEDAWRRGGQLTDVGGPPATVPTTMATVDRDKAAGLGLPVADLLRHVQLLTSTDPVGQVTLAGRAVPVRLILSPAPVDFRDIGKAVIPTPDGKLVPLGQVVTVKTVQVPAFLDRIDGTRAVELSAGPAPGFSIDDARTAAIMLAEDVRRRLGLSDEYAVRPAP